MLTLLFGVSGTVSAAEVTYTFSEHYSSNTVIDETAIALDANVNATFNKRSSGTATQYYTSGSAVRWYGGGTLVIESTKVLITGIVITYTQTANTVSVNTGSYSLSNSIGTWTGSASSVTFTQSGTSGQCRISAIKVTYSSPNPHTVTLDDNSGTLTEETAGAGVTLPTREDIGDYTFEGWSTSNVASETTEAPTIIPAGNYKPLTDITLYPVYKKIVSGSDTNNTVSVTVSEYASSHSWGSSSSTGQKTITIDSNVSATCNSGSLVSR